jgi:ribonucleoside-diphosphate reductase alpha chain
MVSRNVLPQRRLCETFDIWHGGQRFHVSIGRFHDGSIAEIFITGPKSGSDLEAVTRDAAIALSIAAQHNVPLEQIRHRDWLLDPTLDQANKKEWPPSMRVGPLAIRLEEKFWAKWGSILVRTNGCTVRFSPHPRQIGFANAGDARPSHWRPLADQIFRKLQVSVDAPLERGRGNNE